MNFLDRLFDRQEPPARVEPVLTAAAPAMAPRADVSDSATLVGSLGDPKIAEFLRGGGNMTASGAVMTPTRSMKLATAFRCVQILSGAIGTLPLDLKERVDEKTRKDAVKHPLYPVLRRRPNNWQTPGEFKRMMQAMVLLHGDGFAVKVISMGRIIALLPLDAGRMQVKQNRDLSISYTYTTLDGRTVDYKQEELFHLRGLTLDGIRGVSVVRFAAETMGLATQMGVHAASTFKNGASVGGTLETAKGLQDPDRSRLKSDLEEYRGAENANKILLLDNGLKYNRIALSAVDAQLLQIMELSQLEIAMFFGVPPHMLGLTTKTTSWGSGIEQQGIAFVAYTLQDWMTMWQEAIERDLLAANDNVYCRINPAGLIRGDIKTRYAAYAVGRMWGWLSANDVREKEDMDPIEGGDVYLQPQNMIDIKSAMEATEALLSGAKEPGNPGDQTAAAA